MIDWEPGRPKWIQVVEHMRKRIETGVYVPGQMIPGIRGLTEEFGISPNTSRKVLAYLEEELALVKRAPSLGTFVRPEEEWRKK